MALTHTDLERPSGIIDPATFYPGVAQATVDATLDAFLTQGYANATAAGVTDGAVKDPIARAFAYWQAHADVWRRLGATPQSFALNDQGSFTIGSAQLGVWEKLVEQYEAEYIALLAAATAQPIAPVNADVPAPGTRQNVYTW